jgi:hypothetical protein
MGLIVTLVILAFFAFTIAVPIWPKWLWLRLLGQVSVVLICIWVGIKYHATMDEWHCDAYYGRMIDGICVGSEIIPNPYGE